MTKLPTIKTIFLCLYLITPGCIGEAEIAENIPAPEEATNPKELLKLAINKQHIGAYEEAIGILKTALQIDPEFFSAHYRMGFVYEEWDKKKEALKAYENALKIKPQNIDARLGLGSIYAKLKRNELAIEEYKKVATIKPSDPEIHFKIALEYWYIQQIPKAAEHYKKVIEIDTGHMQARLNLASVYERMKEWGNALEQIEMAVKLAKETQDEQTIAIAEGKLPFLKARMVMTTKDLNRKSTPPFD